MGRSNHLSPRRLNRLKADLEEGELTASQLTEKHGISDATLWLWAHRWDLRPRRAIVGLSSFHTEPEDILRERQERRAMWAGIRRGDPKAVEKARKLHLLSWAPKGRLVFAEVA